MYSIHSSSLLATTATTRLSKLSKKESLLWSLFSFVRININFQLRHLSNITGVLFAKMREYSFEDKGKQAHALRKMLRSNFKREIKSESAWYNETYADNILASSTVCKSAFNFVDSVVDSKNVSWPTDEALRTRGGRAGIRGQKRTRNGDADDDDYQPHKRR